MGATCLVAPKTSFVSKFPPRLIKPATYESGVACPFLQPLLGLCVQGPVVNQGVHGQSGQSVVDPSQQEVGAGVVRAGKQGSVEGASCFLPKEGRGPSGWAGDKGEPFYPHSSEPSRASRESQLDWAWAPGQGGDSQAHPAQD